MGNLVNEINTGFISEWKLQISVSHSSYKCIFIQTLLLAHLMGETCDTCQCQFVRPLSIPWSYLENWAKQTHSDCETLLESWHHWFCCHIHIFPHMSPEDIFWFQIGHTIHSNINTAACLTLALDHCHNCYQRHHTAGVVNCCQQTATIVNCRKLLSVVLTTTVVWCHTQTWGGPASFHSHDILIINATVWHVLSIQLTLVCIDNSILHLVLKSVEPHASSTLLWCQSKLQQQ